MANNPIITCSVVDSNSRTIELTNDRDVLIRYHSHALATMSASATAPGASIDMDMYVIRNGSRTGYGTEVTFMYVDNNVFIFSAQDSLGNVETKSEPVLMIEYERLTCNIASSRPDGSGNMVLSCTGAYYNGSFGAKNNTLKVQYRYRTESGSCSAWKNMSVTLTSSAYAATAQLTGLDYNARYTFEIMAEDQLESVTATLERVQSLPLFHWGESDFRFEVPVFMPEACVNGDLVAAHASVADTLTFGNNDAVTLQGADSDFGGLFAIDASQIFLNSSVLYVGGELLKQPQQGIWTPTLFDGAVSSYTRQDGWYTKIGNTVTVGFFIKANCYANNELFMISIYGLPYTPATSVAGSGMCSGACVGGGWNFQCFVAETSGYITTRVQSCNHTELTNLKTSASGCGYPTGGGELTLSGTITYQTNY